MEVRAILLAGGLGSRLLPLTKHTQKCMLAVHDRPILDYCLSTVRQAGIKKITIVANQFIEQISHHVGTGLGDEHIEYVLEKEPRGVLEALILAQPHHLDCRHLVYFVDNITTIDLNPTVEAFESQNKNPGCVMLGREVDNPKDFGVARFKDEILVDVIEKPQHPPSKTAIGGIYLYDETFWDKVQQSLDKHRMNASISDVNRMYIQEDNADLISIGPDTWFDCGTHESLLRVSELARQGRLKPVLFSREVSN